MSTDSDLIKLKIVTGRKTARILAMVTANIRSAIISATLTFTGWNIWDEKRSSRRNQDLRNYETEILANFFRSFYIVAILLSLSLAAVFIFNLNCPDSDATISGKFSPKPIYAVPFPAITICPETKAHKALVNFTALYHSYRSTDGGSGEAEKNVDDDEYVDY